MLRVDLALVHYPVMNRKGEQIAATCDEFDFFDLSRLSLSYPLARVFVVQPVAAQKAMIERMVTHSRKEARNVSERGSFEKTQGVDTIAAAIESIQAETGVAPYVVATSATRRSDVHSLSFAQLRARCQGEHEPGQHEPSPSILLLIGKAWGLAESVFQQVDAMLEPIDSGTGFNHLSVRTATAIIVDRLLRPRELC